MGTKLINKSIQYIIKNDIEFITLEKIYSYLHYKYGFNIHSIRNNINYALTNRNKNLSIKNFEKVFGYEYYEKNFEPKIFIEEVSNIIKNTVKRFINDCIFQYCNFINLILHTICVI